MTPQLATVGGSNPELNLEGRRHSWRTLVLLGTAGLLGLYLVGLDKGALISLLETQLGVDPMLIHELVHDARHIAAFPCH